MIGKTIAQYEILEQLGAGGMGIVYKARDTKLGRIVALKFLPAQFSSDEDAKQRFMQEAQAASALDDPHICTIHDIAEADDGQLFIVMAFYDGSTLKYVIDSEDLPVEKACSIARQIALGLGTAHENGIVHRDVKPANIMVTEKGLVKILDFGVAKLGQSSDLTQAGSTIGTAAYMSPEQARGESVDFRSDVWSIGAVLYEMLSGDRPFGGGYEAAVAYSILNEDPPALTNVPAELAAIVSSALSKDAANRPTSAVDLANSLAEYAGASQVHTGERPAFAPAAAPVAQNQQGIVLKFVLTAAVLLGGLYAAMIALGLPGWVFPTGVLLALAGLPVILYGASLDRERANLDTGERASQTGLKAWLTTKRAYQGGMMAGGGLVAVVILFVILRSAGIGPFATLISGGTLSEQDLIVVADFSNATNDPSLGFTVTEAFRIDLSQSSAVRLMDKSSVQSTLQRMEINADTTLTTSLALQVAEREGAKAIIEGDINSAGAGFILNARILSGSDGSQLAAFRESARSDADILEAIDNLSASLREGVGESLVDIRAEKPLQQVTTSDTEALRAYSQAEEFSNRGQSEDALRMFRRSISLDSTFAMGYRKMAVIMNNLGYPNDSSEVFVEKGYSLRDNLPLRERLLMEAYYQNEIAEDFDEEARIYEEVLRRYPYEVVALNNLSLIYNGQRRYDEVEPLLRRALEVQEGQVFRQNLLVNLINRGLLDQAEEEVIIAGSIYPNSTIVAQFSVTNSYLRDDFESAEAWVDSMAAHSNGTFDQIQVADMADNIRIAQGKIEESQSYRTELRRIQEERFPETDPVLKKGGELSNAMDRAWEIALLTGDTREWRSAFDETVVFLESEEFRQHEDFDDSDFYGFFANVLTTMGYPEEAVTWDDKHIAYHERNGGEMTEYGRLSGAYARGSTGANIRENIEIIETELEEFGCSGCFRNLLGDLEMMDGNLDAAIDYYVTFTSTIELSSLSTDEGTIAVGLFRLGDLYEQRGDIDEAIEAYTRMANRWKDADAVLQPQVAEAHRRIQTLLDRKATEN